MPDFSFVQIIALSLMFMWAGFVRTGIGFGGAALGLPLLLLVHPDPLIWLPIIGIHLLFFSALTLRKRLHNVDWDYLRRSAIYIIPPAIIGVFGLLSLPTLWINIFIYLVCLFYGLMWMFDRSIHSEKGWIDTLLLMIGGYVAGTSLTGAPLMVAVYVKNVAKEQLRDTLFVLWFVLVSIKMSTFVALSVPLNLAAALMLIPVAAIGHVLGLKLHEHIMQNDVTFKRWIGGALAVISMIALYRLL